MKDKLINYNNLSQFYDDLKFYDLSTKQDKLTTGHNITIDSSFVINAEGYIFDSSNGSLVTIYRQEQEDGGMLKANTATGLSSIAIGYDTSSGGLCSYAEGLQTIASNEAAHAEGAYNTTASGKYSHAEGGGTTSSGNGSHSEGSATIASGNSAHAEGQYSVASGKFAHAEGARMAGFDPTTASGNGSHAEGQSTLASGKCAHAEGEITKAIADSCHSEGQRTIASAIGAHAEGCWWNNDPNDLTTASGRGSHAEGGATKAIGDCAHSEGIKTTAQNETEHAEGQFNVSHKATTTYGNAGNTQHSIGIGTSSNAHKNALEIMQNGDCYIYGIGGYQGVDTSVQDATIQTLQTYISSLESRIYALEHPATT